MGQLALAYILIGFALAVAAIVNFDLPRSYRIEAAVHG